VRSDEAVRAAQAVSRDRDLVIASRCEVAESSRARTVGLLGRDGLGEEEGLWISPCNSIHTWFMRFAIDVLFLDQDNVIVRVAEEIVPFRMRLKRGARSVLELPAGRAARVGVQTGEKVDFVPVAD